jgi:hypothetical protein
MVGPSGFEPPTSPLSGVRSNQLSYGPKRRSGETARGVSQLRRHAGGRKGARGNLQ